MWRVQDHNTEVLLKGKYKRWCLRQIQSQTSEVKQPETWIRVWIIFLVSAAIPPQICWCMANCKQYSTSKLFHGYSSTHTPPSVVLLWIHVVTGEAPTSLLQETLMLYHVIACSPGTSYWKGGTVTLINRVIVTSPFLRLTSLALDGIENVWGSMRGHQGTA